MEIDLTSFLKLNWRQGAILTDQLSDEISKNISITFSKEAGDQIVVISHDCDVNALSFIDEPNAELIIARKAVRDGTKKMGKSSRFLQLEVAQEEAVTFFEIRASDKFTVSRQLLVGHSPVEYLSSKNSTFLSEWLARRYSRAAFPTSFDARVKPIKDKVKKCLKGVSEDIFGIYFHLTEDEMPEGEPYKVVGFAIMLDSDFSNSTKLDRSKNAMVKLQGLLNSVQIEFDDDIEIVSDKEFTLKDMRPTKRWDWDVLSYDEGQSGYVNT